MTLPISLRDEQLLLHPARALLWPARATLLVADTHFGKDDVFRRAGIAMPRGPAVTDLQRLSQLIETYSCERLVILGDFLHAATHRGDAFLHAFNLWKQAHRQLAVEIVAGNHDRYENTARWHGLMRWHAQSLQEPPFVFAHQPHDSDAGYVLAGHIHPVLRLQRRLGAGRVPVFWRRAGHMVLPSFGSLTGGANIMADAGDELYAAGPERVMLLPVIAR
jgi:uncharacterized protein